MDGVEGNCLNVLGAVCFLLATNFNPFLGICFVCVCVCVCARARTLAWKWCGALLCLAAFLTNVVS